MLKQFEAELQQQLPPGTSRQDVRLWFEHRGFQVYEMMRENNRVSDLAVIIRNDSLVESAEISVYLYFDRDGQRLERIDVRRFVFSL